MDLAPIESPESCGAGAALPPGDGEAACPQPRPMPAPAPYPSAPHPSPPLSSAPSSGPGGASILAEWRQAEAGLAAPLARVAGRLGALDQRLRAGPEGWRHRLALLEASDLSWHSGDRVAPDRLALWVSLRLAGVHQDMAALARAGWAVRRLTGGPGPVTASATGLGRFLGRHDPATAAEPLQGRAHDWLGLMSSAQALHPISRACMGHHLWNLAGPAGGDSRTGAGMEAAVVAVRIAADQGRGAVFAPLAMGGAGGLRGGGSAAARLARWLEGMDAALRRASRQLDEIEAWATRAQTAMARLSGRTPRALCAVLGGWPLVSAPMAATLTGASRASVQRSLTWMEARGLIREVTGQGRFRMWSAAARARLPDIPAV